MLDIADAASTGRPPGRARRAEHPAGRAGRDRLRGDRPRRRRDHPAAHVRLGRRRRAADHRRRRRAGGQQHPDRPCVISFVDAPDWSTSLATMMGIGIGIDYALLMVTRFREWRAAGLDPEAATVATLDTAGRSVMVAGSTVVISMLGLFAMGLSFMRGAAVVTILAVLVVMAGQHHALPGAAGLPRPAHRPAAPAARARRARSRWPIGGHVEPSRGWLAWSRLVDRHRVAAASSASSSCWRWPRRSSPSASASPTPATTVRRPAPGRPTTCWPRASAPA